MVSSIKKYTMTLNGQSYTIVSDEPESLITQAVSLVEQRAGSLMQSASTSLDVQKVMMLAAVEIARDLIRAQQQVGELVGEQSRLVSRIEREVGL